MNDSTAMYISESGQLWASGNQPQINVKSSEPKKVTFFEGRVVSEISCGSNFNVAIARKCSRSTKDTDSENDLDDEVFVRSCPQCLSVANASPRSATSSDTCPLELHQLGDDRSITSAISSLAESEPGKKSGAFFNANAARQFLTRQLPWVSSYSKDDVFQESADEPANLLKQNVSSVANLVFEGVKTVGDKVATLSRHVSGSSDVNDTANSKIFFLFYFDLQQAYVAYTWI